MECDIRINAGPRAIPLRPGEGREDQDENGCHHGLLLALRVSEWVTMGYYLGWQLGNRLRPPPPSTSRGSNQFELELGLESKPAPKAPW